LDGKQLVVQRAVFCVKISKRDCKNGGYIKTMNSYKFARTFRGFKPSSVIEYLSNLESKYEKEIKEKQKTIEELQRENDELKKKLGKLEEEFSKLNEQKIKIAELLIIAQEKAESIVSKAIEEGENKKKVLLEEIEEHEKTLQGLKEEIKRIKSELQSVISKFEDEIENKG